MYLFFKLNLESRDNMGLLCNLIYAKQSLNIPPFALGMYNIKYFAN